VTRTRWTVLILAALVAAGTGGYWIGQFGLTLPPHRMVVAETPAGPPSGPVIYYQDPDGKPDYSAEPRNTPDGRPYHAVHASEDINFDPRVVRGEPANLPGGKRILYYRNPMGLPDVSKTPKKDAMGMDYIAVYEGEDDDGATVKISPGKLQRIGVRSEPATLRVIAEPVRAPGTIQLDERRVAVISLRAEAFIETVEDVTSGSVVRKGQSLMRLYSPAIASAASEYLSTHNLKGDVAALRGPRQRLLN
jgi:Cu(I)/Ag(I) efflux system membrane fusion protein